MARSSSPVTRAAVVASSRDLPAPRAMLPGNCVAGGPTRTTLPCSWSMEVSTGMGTRCVPTACWTALPNSASATGVVTFSPK